MVDPHVTAPAGAPVTVTFVLDQHAVEVGLGAAVLGAWVVGLTDVVAVSHSGQFSVGVRSHRGFRAAQLLWGV